MSQPTLDYYAVLHVSPEAPTEVIKASYRALSRKYHPDQNGGSSRFVRKMQELSEAYTVLIDPELREQYDEARCDDGNSSAKAESPQLIKTCPNCGTRNRLRQGVAKPNCGKCRSSLLSDSDKQEDTRSNAAQGENAQRTTTCPNCGTKNSLLQGAINPDCGKCGYTLHSGSNERDVNNNGAEERKAQRTKICPNCGAKNRLLADGFWKGPIKSNCGKCGCSLEGSDEQNGQIPSFLAGRFKVVRLLGEGGFGQVYLCEDSRLGRPVALKILNDIESSASLKREATTLSKLSHPSLTQVFDYLEDGNRGALVSEYVKGPTLAQFPYPQNEADVLKWALALADVLDYLHNQTPPVIHRDIKPNNIIIDSKGRPRLLDFGISKKTANHGATSTTALGGTPGYAPPEQYAARSGQTDAQSDLYSYGATLFCVMSVFPASLL